MERGPLARSRQVSDVEVWMATYAVGDIHGCFETLQRLLEAMDFRAGHDRIWLVGDLVNGGPDSSDVVRWAREVDAVVTLGNHDLHMLAVAARDQPLRKKDSFGDLLDAPDAAELLGWLRTRKLAHQERVGDDEWLMIHAGLLPQWSIARACAHAREIEALLADAAAADAFFAQMYGDDPRQWSDELEGLPRERLLVNALTRCRIMTPDGGLQFTYKGTLGDVPHDHVPWFRAPEARWKDDETIVLFGHWSALGHHVEGNVICLDSGCVWGRELTALRLEDRRLFQVESELPRHVH